MMAITALDTAGGYPVDRPLSAGPRGELVQDRLWRVRPPDHKPATPAAVNYPIGALCIRRSLRHFRAALGEAEAWRGHETA